MSKLLFFIQEAFRALRRNGAPSMAAIVTTVVTVILLGVLIPVLQTAQSKSNEVRDSLEFRVAVYDDATKAEVAALQRKLEAIPHVASVEFIDKGEALAELEGDLGKEKSDDLLAQVRSNPLPRNFAVKADDAAHLKEVRAAVIPPGADGKPQPISSIIPTKDGIFDRREESEKIEQVTGALKIILTAITALLIVASLMLVGNTIRLSIYTRRREVEVMRLVGATRWFIRWPFMIEGIVVGLVGGLVAILILWLGKLTVVDPLNGTLSFLARQDFALLMAILFASAVLVSAIGSGITLRRFLKV
jgi:cell division transport system permease protein